MAAQGTSGFGRFRGLLASRPDAEPRPVRPASGMELEQALLLLHDYENSGLGWFWSTDREGRIVYISDVVAQKLGKTRDQLLGEPFTSLFIRDPEEEDLNQRTLPLSLTAHKTFSVLELRGACREEVWWAISGRPQFSGSNDFTGFLGNGSDVTASRRSRRAASRLAEYDSLTGLSNRHRVSQQLASILTAYKAAQRVCALMMMDLDRFKQVNDTLGHPAGDELLKQVAGRLKQVIPDNCQIGRLGGDEFQVILPDVDDRGRLGDIARQIIEMVSQPYSIAGSRCVIGASVGIAIAPYDGIDSDELTRSADLALYAAKGGGRGRFRFYSGDLHAEAERRRQLEDDLRDALARDEMRLAYQPIVDVKTNKVVCLEASLRWCHAEMGEVTPGVFLPIAEECKLIGALGDWALKKACEDAVQWPGNLKVAVNIPPAQFANPAFPAVVTQALSASGLTPDRLELEVTESVFLSDVDLLEQTVKSLRILGVRLALDNFGTGHSALAYLQKADFDKIKIDRSFIRGITEEGSRSSAIIRSIVALAQGLRMESVAADIEARDELDMMRKLGVDQIQGVIYATPASFEDVVDAMAAGEWIIEPIGPNNHRSERMTMLRKIGLIHEDHRYDVTMRNLSRTGCLVEGLLEVPLGTQFVVDFGEGQLAVATVRRSAGSLAGLEFEMSLVDDGAGGLCTRNRVSPYLLAAAGMPLAALPAGDYPLGPGATNGPAAFSMPKFAQVNEAGRKAVRTGSI